MGALDVLLEVSKDVAPALVTGVGGSLATIWKLGKSALQRLTKLESRFSIVAAQIESTDAELKSLTAEVHAISSSVNQLRGELESIRRGSVTTEKHARLYEKMSALERRVSDLDAELTRQMDTLTVFVKDQSEQWQSVNRLLGQLEGQLEWLTKSK